MNRKRRGRGEMKRWGKGGQRVHKERSSRCWLCNMEYTRTQNQTLSAHVVGEGRGTRRTGRGRDRENARCEPLVVEGSSQFVVFGSFLAWDESLEAELLAGLHTGG